MKRLVLGLLTSLFLFSSTAIAADVYKRLSCISFTQVGLGLEFETSTRSAQLCFVSDVTLCNPGQAVSSKYENGVENIDFIIYNTLTDMKEHWILKFEPDVENETMDGILIPAFLKVKDGGSIKLPTLCKWAKELRT